MSGDGARLRWNLARQLVVLETQLNDAAVAVRGDAVPLANGPVAQPVRVGTPGCTTRAAVPGDQHGPGRIAQQWGSPLTAPRQPARRAHPRQRMPPRASPIWRQAPPWWRPGQERPRSDVIAWVRRLRGRHQRQLRMGQPNPRCCLLSVQQAVAPVNVADVTQARRRRGPSWSHRSSLLPCGHVVAGGSCSKNLGLFAPGLHRMLAARIRRLVLGSVPRDVVDGPGMGCASAAVRGGYLSAVVADDSWAAYKEALAANSCTRGAPSRPRNKGRRR